MSELPLHRRAGALSRDGLDVLLEPRDAGWRFSGLRVVRLASGASHTFTLHGFEAALIPLAAQQVRVDVTHPQHDDVAVTLAGRAGVFAGITDWLYAPTGSSVTVTAGDVDAELALATAVAEDVHPIAHVPSSAYPVVARGAGSASRQINLPGHPDAFAGAHRLVWCEVLTPDGNWSSYPPHRHDGIGDCPYENEEIYYFRIGTTDADGRPSAHGAPEGFGIHRTYTDPGVDPGPPIDATVEVRDGDVFLVPRGYHGPSIAAPGYPMYYLNVLAGPGPRTLGFCDDPAHAHLREAWASMELDPRVPMSSPLQE